MGSVAIPGFKISLQLCSSRAVCTKFPLHKDWPSLDADVRIATGVMCLPGFTLYPMRRNNSLLRQHLDAERQLTLRIIKLIIRLAFITHV